MSAAPALEHPPSVATQPACRVERVRLFRFRNYAEETIELGPGLNVLSGCNAQGKTNLLEAVATLALTRSPRAATLGELVAWGEPACRVEARIRRPQGRADLDMRITRGGGPDGETSVRSTRIDGRERPARALLGVCPVVLFWPDDLQLVKGPPEGRRRLLDVVLSQLDPVAADDLVRFRRVLEQRNALLRQIRHGSASTAALPQFTAAFALAGGAVRVHRSRLVEELSPLAAAALQDLSGGGEDLRLVYAAGGDHPADGDTEIPRDAAAAAEALLAEIEARRPEELARGTSVAGPHRDDVAVLLGGRAARSTASQGQQRSAVLACKLAEVRHVASAAGMTPVLLLDDVLSELDAGRRERLLAGLGAVPVGQALLTTTEDAPPELAALGALRQFRVTGGHVLPANAS